MPEFRTRPLSSSKATKLGRGSHTDLIIDAEELTVTSSVESLLDKLRQPIEPAEDMIKAPRQLTKPTEGAVGKPRQPIKPTEDLVRKVWQPIELKPRWCPPGLSK